MTQTHLNHLEYTNLLEVLHQKSCYHAIVLDCGVAGIIRYFKINQDFFYEDEFITNHHLFDMINSSFNREEIHAEIYQKMALINKMYS